MPAIHSFTGVSEPTPPPLSSSPSPSPSLVVPRLIGATTAGVLELLCFHPIDTMAKRLMHNTAPLTPSRVAPPPAVAAAAATPPSVSTTTLRRVLFKQHADSSALRRAQSLFPGLGVAAVYKVTQRLYKFGGQPVVSDLLARHWGAEFRWTFGASAASTLQHACAGSLIGIGEVLLLPLDNLKIKAQTRPSGIPLLSLLSSPRPSLCSLYAGTSWTIARNAPGSFALFGAAELTRSLLPRPSPLTARHSPTPLLHHLIASVCGATLSILVSAPMDTIKTRVQAAGFGEGVKGWQVVERLMREEGVGALWKGCVPKLLVVGPKLVFSFTIATALIERLSQA